MYTERNIRLNNAKELASVTAFLQTFDLTFQAQVDYTVAFYKDDQIIATGSLSGKVLRNIAVDPSHQGEGLLSSIISHLMAEGARRGYYSFLLFTKPENFWQFTATGFRTVAIAAPYAALLEIGLGGIDDFCAKIKQSVSLLAKEKNTALVMNCNPFTLGHRALIEYAAANSKKVCLFVVQEDKSVFPFADRFELVKAGVADLSNVHVLAGGDYIISRATFPTYFLKSTEALTAQTLLDATVFAERIAPALNISQRFVGEEPTDLTTRAYNAALLAVLPTKGIALQVIPRLSSNGQIISASKVRQALLTDDWQTINSFLPLTTISYLKSTRGQQIIEKIKQT